MTSQTLVPGGSLDSWGQAIYAFSAEKECRFGSMRTVVAYSGMLYRFFRTLGKPPDQVTAPEVLATSMAPVSLAKRLRLSPSMPALFA